MVRDVTHPAHNSRVAVKKIGLKGLTSEKSKTGRSYIPVPSEAKTLIHYPTAQTLQSPLHRAPQRTFP